MDDIAVCGLKFRITINAEDAWRGTIEEDLTKTTQRGVGKALTAR